MMTAALIYFGLNALFTALFAVMIHKAVVDPVAAGRTVPLWAAIALGLVIGLPAWILGWTLAGVDSLKPCGIRAWVESHVRPGSSEKEKQ